MVFKKKKKKNIIDINVLELVLIFQKIMMKFNLILILGYNTAQKHEF